MFQLQPVNRNLKTSEPRFKRLNRIISPDSRISTQQSFNSKGKGFTFDNSKQNLLFQNHLSKVRSACKLDQTTIVSKYLSSIRKDYDELNKESRKQLNSMKLRKREIDFIRHKNDVFLKKRQELEALIESQKLQTEQVQLKEEDAKMQTKTLENIKVRMKKDQIYYKMEGRIRDELLKKTTKELKFLDETLIHEEEKLHKLNSELQNCITLYNKNRAIRQKKFEDFTGTISDVKERERFIHERKERTYQLQSIQLNDTLDQKNIHMREIMLAHKVADSLLEGKVNTLIKKYAQIQGAFHLVKIKTGVSEPQQLTNKFFSYEQTSESLLSTISQNEKHVQFLREKKLKLEQHYKKLNSEHLLQDGIQMTKDRSTNQEREKIISETNKNILLFNQISAWINRMINEVRCEDKPVEIDQRFSTLCQNLQQNLNQYEDFSWQDYHPQTMGICLKKMIREKSPEQLSIRMRETQDMNDSNLIQQEYIKDSRKTIQKKAFTIKQIKREHHD